MCSLAVSGLFADQLEQALLQHAGATGNQVYRYAHACMHIADDALVGNQLLDVVGRCAQQVPDPTLHGRLQSYPDLVM